MPMMSPSGWKSLGRYGSIGFELIASILIGFFLGRWLDRHFGWHSVGTIGGVLLGTYTGFRTLFRRAKEAEREMDMDDARERKRAAEEGKIAQLKRDDEAEKRKEAEAEAGKEDDE
jgi:hypothetical protein